jgi:O-methyltransferase
VKQPIRKIRKVVIEGMRSSFARLGPHRMVPRGLSDAAKDFAYLLDMSRWINKHIDRDLNVGYDRFQLFAQIIEQQGLDNAPIDYLEFGTASGTSLRWWLERNHHPESRFESFDTFTGLPENWGSTWATDPAGTFSQQGRVPQVDDARCRFHVGLFSSTLPSYLAGAKLNRRTVVHVDPDLYSSTLYLLTMLAPHMKPADILLLADFCSLRHPTHVFRAFHDFVSAYHLDYNVLASSNFGHQVAALINARPIV